VPKNVPAYGGYGAYGAYPPPKAVPTAADLANYPRLEPTPDETPTDDIKAYVIAAQVRLMAAGTLARTTSTGKTNADGLFWGTTEEAVEKFQRARGLPETGIIDYNTWLALYNISKSSTTKTGTSTTKPTTSRDAAKEAEDKSSPYWEQFLYSAGIARAKDVQKVSGDTFAPSVASAPAGPDWQKIALWSGVAIGGIAITYFVVKAIRN